MLGDIEFVVYEKSAVLDQHLNLEPSRRKTEMDTSIMVVDITNKQTHICTCNKSLLKNMKVLMKSNQRMK